VVNDADGDRRVSGAAAPATVGGCLASEGEVACEWLLLEVSGMSFLLHQIRKMVATAVDVSRRVPPEAAGLAEEPEQQAAEAAAEEASGAAAMAAVLAVAFGGGKVSTPMAPALGLYLDSPFFDQYNK
jgi:tRNA U38,U39,U40 pseudouridine synthase TruA